MNFKGILFFLGINSFFISLLSFVNILYSIYFQFYLDLSSYVFCFFISLTIGFVTYFFGNKEKKKINIFDQLIIIILGFFYIPLLISIPYFLSSYGFSFSESYFEAISGFTSTGFSIIENINILDEPLLIWRSVSQWLGGLFFIVCIISTLGINKIKIKPVYLLTGSYEGGNFYNNLSANFTKVFFTYCFLTILIILLFILSGVRLFDSFNLSFTIISAGGFLNSNDLSNIIINNLQTFVISLTLLFPILNFFIIFKIFTSKNKFYDNYEDFYLILIIILFVILFYFFLTPQEELVNIFFMVTSSLSTSGIFFNTYKFDFPILLILLTIIGGSSLSTSSGFKFLRIYILIKTSINEMYKLVKPMNIFNRKLFTTEYKIDDKDVKIVFFIFISFIFSIFILSSLLTLDNINFENAFKLSILTLNNTTASSLFGIFDLDFSELGKISIISLSIFMVLGKLEIIAIFMLIKKFILRE